MSNKIIPIDPKAERSKRMAYQWVMRQRISNLRVLARIDGLSRYDAGESSEEDGKVFLGGHDTNWAITAMIALNDIVQLNMFSCHENLSEFEEECGWVRQGQFWIIDGEFHANQDDSDFSLHGGTIYGPQFTPVPKELIPGISSYFD